MKSNGIAAELIRMKQHDLEVRRRLLAEGKLFDGYAPEMERVHLEQSRRLEEIIEETGYPVIGKVGKEASNAAWLLIQHAISRPDFMKRMLALLKSLPPGEVDARNLAFLEDRIRMYEGKPQLYGTQFDWDENGRLAPVLCDDPGRVNQRRKKLGMPSLEEQTDRFRKEQDFFPDRAFLEQHRKKYRSWLIETGWRTGKNTPETPHPESPVKEKISGKEGTFRKKRIAK